jgi:tetratricopeptide (TPR) repeat protein
VRFACRCVLVAITTAVLPVLSAEERPEPMEPLQPRSDFLMYPEAPAEEQDAVEVTQRSLDIGQLSADVAAMSRAAERLRAALRQNKIPGYEDLLEEQAQIIRTPEEQFRRREGEPRVSSRLGSNDLQVQAYSNGGFEVTARISNERVKMVYGELLYLLGFKWNDQDVANPNQRIDVHVENLPWDDALTRILGQAGLAWQERSGEETEVVIYDTRIKPELDRVILERYAARALDHAVGQRNNEIAAEAMFLRAERDRRLRRYRAAVVEYLDLVTTFEAKAGDSPAIRRWMHKSFLGMAECFMATEQYHEARSRFLTYISLAEEDDPVLAEVYLKAADSSRLLGRSTGDVGAYVKAMELLDHLVHKYGGDPTAAGVVTKAHNMLGVIYFVREEYRAAKEQLMRFRETGGTASHQLLFYLGECDFALAKDARASYQHDRADLLLESARTYYQEIADAYVRGHADPLVDELVYRDAFYQLGLCHMYLRDPDFVGALYAFLEARRTFPQSAIDASILVHIAHCYAELESDTQTIQSLYDLLGRDDIDNAELELASLLGNIQTSLGDYPSSVRAKVLFYIAQAHFHAAARDRLERERYQRAAATYTRVLQEGNPDPALAVAARLGKARALIAYGDDEPGEQVLIEVLRSAQVPGRDRAFAAQLLGRLYQERGQLRKAIQAYRGELVE